MVTISFTEYAELVPKVHADNPSWRLGQAYFNLLYRVHPDLANQIRSTVIDPFFSDSIIPEFLDDVERRWYR